MIYVGVVLAAFAYTISIVKSVMKAMPVSVFEENVNCARHTLFVASQEYPVTHVEQTPSTEQYRQFVINTEHSVQTARMLGMRSVTQSQTVAERSR